MNKNLKKLSGVVVSNKMQDSVVVKIDSVRTSRLYRKKYKVSKKINAHVADGRFEVGEQVTIEPIRPISKTKRYIVAKKDKK